MVGRRSATTGATGERVLALASRGVDDELIGRHLGIRPGLAHLLATGLPADGGARTEDVARPGLLGACSQHLVSPPPDSPIRDPTVLAWVRERARGDPSMAAAARRRSVGPVSSDGGGPTPVDANLPGGLADDDVLVVLTRSHNQVRSLFKELETIPGLLDDDSMETTSRRNAVVDRIVATLSAHEAAEEAVFWPAVADLLDTGDTIAETARQQERDAKRSLDELRRLARHGMETARFDELVETLSRSVRRHVAFEEAVFLEVEARLPNDQRRVLGRLVQRAMRRGPTRPHPLTPSDAAVLHLAAPVVGVLDRLRDALGNRPGRRAGRATVADNGRRRHGVRARTG